MASNAVAYVRVSSRGQEREGYSIPAQRKLLREYAAAEGIRITKVFEDVETAKRAGRTGFTEMIRFLKKAGAGCRIVLVEKTDRLYRNFKDYRPWTSWIWRSTSSAKASSCRGNPVRPRSSCTGSRS